jgi:hypothetical protein
MEQPSLFGENDDGSFVPFTDILFNALLGFAFMIFIAFSLINPEAKLGTVELKAEMIITVSWPDNNPDDIDTYVEEPGGNIVWYHSREAGLVHLDRDDRGNYRDTLNINGQDITNPLNQETVTIRSFVPGEYVVNVVHYLANSGNPVPVTVKVERINPKVEVVYYGTVELNQRGQEETVVRFTISPTGVVSDINSIQKSLVGTLNKA